MKITDVEVITFRVQGVKLPHHRWGYSVVRPGRTDEENAALMANVETIDRPMTITKISTDEGIAGYQLGGDKAQIEGLIKPMLVGEDPHDREKFWHWMDQVCSFRGPLTELQMGIVDCALWDLAGRLLDLPVYKLLGGARKKVKAYASTLPNIGDPEVYARHALSCKEQGYKAYKVHAYICWDPINWQPAPAQPAFPREDVAVCRAVREAVGDDMVLMLDPFGGYTLEEALWVGRELEKLNFYWLEHPMIETRVEAYRRLTRELSINICSPEHVRGGLFSRAEWLLQGAADMLRIDAGYGGLTACWKTAILCQAYGLKCELHGGAWYYAAHSQIFGATTESTCEYYERGLLAPGIDGNTVAPYLLALPDPMDDDGNVILPETPGLGMEFNWDYINENRIDAGK